MSVRYLSVLDHDDAWLAELRHRLPGVDVMHLPTARLDDVPAEVWASVDVLHTYGPLPEPAHVPKLRWVQLDTSGVDHVRESELWTHTSIPITTIGGISPVPLAEFVLFSILGMAHRLPAMLRLRETRAWPTPQRRWQDFMPATVAGATLGILGYGRIGREVGRLARACGMNVVGLNRTGALPSDDRRATQMIFDAAHDGSSGVQVRPVGDLLDAARTFDYLVVVCPLTSKTRGIVDEHVLAALRPGAVVVNVSRGHVVDESALRRALRSGHLGGAVLDVFGTEPLPAEDEWWNEPNVLVSPHASGLAPRYREQVLELVVENMNRLTSGRPLVNVVDRTEAY